jgi:hypothetical protein
MKASPKSVFFDHKETEGVENRMLRRIFEPRKNELLGG